VPARLAAAKKIAKLAELKGVNRSTVVRELIDIGLDTGQVLLLQRRPGAKGRTEVERVIRVVAAGERVKVTQAAVTRAPSVETELNALRAEEEQAEAMAAYHHHLRPPRPLQAEPLRFLDGAPGSGPESPPLRGGRVAGQPGSQRPIMRQGWMSAAG
jgi:hypothetical protein